MSVKQGKFGQVRIEIEELFGDDISNDLFVHSFTKNKWEKMKERRTQNTGFQFK